MNDKTKICPSCGRDVLKMHPDRRSKRFDGKWSHLELDPETGATVSVEEKD